MASLAALGLRRGGSGKKRMYIAPVQHSYAIVRKKGKNETIVDAPPGVDTIADRPDQWPWSQLWPKHPVAHADAGARTVPCPVGGGGCKFSYCRHCTVRWVSKFLLFIFDVEYGACPLAWSGG